MKKRRILVADGDREVGLSIQEYLKRDYTVYYVDNGKDILSTIEENNIELLITDIEIPNVYIYNLINQIKDKNPDFPLILMYVYCDYTQEMEATIRRLADAIFLKPFDMGELKKRIDFLLSKKVKIAAK